MKDKINRLIRFFTEDIWHIRADDTTQRQFFLIRNIRIFFIAIKGFINDNCQQMASAMTFYSLLSVVPVFAMVFGIAKGFGFEKKIEELLANRLEGQEEVLRFVSDFAINYLERTPGGEIAGVGLVVLFWSIMKVFGNIETSFNNIWKVKHARTFIRKFSDYISLMLVGVLLLISSSGMMVFVSKHLKSAGFDGIIGPNFALLLSFILILGVFTLLQYIMPNNKVRFLSALFGGVISGFLFQLLQLGYIKFQAMVTSYNAIYGSFAALPFFLIWLQASWLIVLLGAELSFAYQNASSYEFDADIRKVSYNYRRLVVLMVVSYVVKKFEKGEDPPSSMELSNALKLPISLLNDVLFDLVECKVFSEIANDDLDETIYQPAMDINKLTIMKTLFMYEDLGSRNLHFEDTESLKHLQHILEKFRDDLVENEENLLIKDL